jgi:hypothetical protein
MLDLKDKRRFNAVMLNNVKSNDLFEGTQAERVTKGYIILKRLRNLRSDGSQGYMKAVEKRDKAIDEAKKRFKDKQQAATIRKGVPEGIPVASYISYNKILTNDNELGEFDVSDTDSTNSDEREIERNLDHLAEVGIMTKHDVKSIKAANKAIDRALKVPSKYDSAIKVLEAYLPPLYAPLPDKISDESPDDMLNTFMSITKLEEGNKQPTDVVTLVLNNVITTEGKLIDNISLAVVYIEEQLSMNRDLALQDVNMAINKSMAKSIQETKGNSPLFKEISKMNVALSNRFDPVKLYEIFKLHMSDGAQQIFKAWSEHKQPLMASQLFSLMQSYYFADINKLMLQPFSDYETTKMITDSITFENVRDSLSKLGKLSEKEKADLFKLADDLTVKEASEK